MVPPQFTATLRPYPVPTDRKRNIGRTRLRLLNISAEPLRKEFGAFLLLPCTKRQFSDRRMVARTGFHHRVCFINFTIFLKQSQRQAITIISEKQRFILCTLTWTLVYARRNVLIKRHWFFESRCKAKKEGHPQGVPLFVFGEHYRYYWKLLQLIICIRQHSFGMQPDAHGFSHGLNKCPPDTCLPHLWWGRPLRIP